MQIKTRYIGDARIRKLLDSYSCPYPFHIARAIMMGDIASPLMGSPTATVESLWDGELPEFETSKEAQAFFGSLLGLWNHLTRHQKRSHPFKLVTSRPPTDRKGLEDYCQMRVEELHAILEGFFQGEGEMDLSPELEDCVGALEDTRVMFFASMQMLADKTVPTNKEELEKLRKNLDRVLGIGNRECAGLVWAASDYRKSQLPKRPPPATIH